MKQMYYSPIFPRRTYTHSDLLDYIKSFPKNNGDFIVWQFPHELIVDMLSEGFICQDDNGEFIIR